MSAVKLHLCVGGSCRQFEHVVRRSLSLRLMRFPAMFAIIEHPREGVALFDTGYGRQFFEATARFPERLYALTTPVALGAAEPAVEQLRQRGIAPGDVRTVVISHFHGDHIAALSDFPFARFVCLSDAWESIRRRSRVDALRHGFLPALVPADFEARLDPLEKRSRVPLPGGFEVFGCGHDLFGDGAVVGVELGGHARGQCGLVVRADDGLQYFLVADACWTREALDRQVLPHPVARALFDDSRAYAATLARLGEVARRAPSTVIVPSHCERTLRSLGADRGHP